MNTQAEQPGITAFSCGHKRCKDGQQHKYDGPVVDAEDGSWSSVSCSVCGWLAIEGAVWE